MGYFFIGLCTKSVANFRMMGSKISTEGKATIQENIHAPSHSKKTKPENPTLSSVLTSEIMQDIAHERKKGTTICIA